VDGSGSPAACDCQGRSAESGSNMAASSQHNGGYVSGYFSDDMGSETSRKYRCSRRQCAGPPPLQLSSSETSRKYWPTPSSLTTANQFPSSYHLITVYLRPLLTPNCNFYNKLLISHQIAIFHYTMMGWKKFTIQNNLKKVRKINNLKQV